jgi:hypothetical protein
MTMFVLQLEAEGDKPDPSASAVAVRLHPSLVEAIKSLEEKRQKAGLVSVSGAIQADLTATGEEATIYWLNEEWSELPSIASYGAIAHIANTGNGQASFPSVTVQEDGFFFSCYDRYASVPTQLLTEKVPFSSLDGEYSNQAYKL